MATPAPVRNLTSALGSTIISDFPEIFVEFRGKWFSLLWRGSRDGFGAPEFHEHCDGHANTLTLIKDTKGNIFGVFTPVEWESEVFHSKADASLKSFIFTLKNPHNVPAQRFALKGQKKNEAIWCGSKHRPDLNDITVNANSNEDTVNLTSLGNR
jgi:hypothetical protein